MSSPIQQSAVPVETEAERQERLAWEAQAIDEALRSIEEEGTEVDPTLRTTLAGR
jgi:hypothetical protein